MGLTRATTRRSVLAGAAGLVASPAIIGRAVAATRGVSDTEIIIGMMTDLSGVTAVQGTNAANSIRMAFDDVNAKGGINGRKIRFIVEDMEYMVPKAVQAMNKLVNLDNIFLSISSGGTPQMDAVLPMMIEKQVPSVFPLTCARSMYLPLSPYKYGQFSSYYDQMRSCVKYFAETKGRKVFGSMYEDTDFGKDIHAGVVDQVNAMNLKLGAVATFSPTATDFNSHVSRHQGCGLRSRLHGHDRAGHDHHPADGAQDGMGRGLLRSVRELFHRGGRGTRGAGGRLLLDVARGLCLFRRSSSRGPRDHDTLQAALRHRHQLSRRGRLRGGGLPHRGAAAGRTRPEPGDLPEVDGKHQGLARHVRRSAADDHRQRPPRLHTIVPVGGEEGPVDACGRRAIGVPTAPLSRAMRCHPTVTAGLAVRSR